MAWELEVGSVFTRRYRVIRRLGAGGMGAVYEAEHLRAGRRVALKVMRSRASSSAILRERFSREARILAGIQSEHVVRVLDAGIDEQTEMPYLVMELLDGTDLERLLGKEGIFSPADTLRYLCQVALALDAIKGTIVHRDLKPANLFLVALPGVEPRVKVLDFGVAKVLDGPSDGSSRTDVLGTPMYMSPEQFRGTGVSHAADVYALGLVAYTFLTGRPYWAEEWEQPRSSRSFMRIARHGPPEKASARALKRTNVLLPPGFDEWFARATARLPENRFSTAPEAMGALADALGQAKPLQAARSAPPRRAFDPESSPSSEPAQSVTGATASRTPTGAPSVRWRVTVAGIPSREPAQAIGGHLRSGTSC